MKSFFFHHLVNSSEHGLAHSSENSLAINSAHDLTHGTASQLHIDPEYQRYCRENSPLNLTAYPSMENTYPNNAYFMLFLNFLVFKFFLLVLNMGWLCIALAI